MKIRRQFVRLGQRHAHFRVAGSGPALLLLHQSPQNSRMWLAMIERFADRYTVIAPDTPGFGYSDALETAQPSIAEPTARSFAATLRVASRAATPPTENDRLP